MQLIFFLRKDDEARKHITPPLRSFAYSERSLAKGHSLYQISSKMLPGSKVITLVEKKEKRWPGWD